MAERVEISNLTAPAGTPQSAPVEVACTFPPGLVEGIEIVIPDGHAGLTGIAIALAHQVIIPNTHGQFITGNDEVVKWPLDGFPNTGAWSAFVYNTDTFSHDFHIRWLVNEIRPRSSVFVPPTPGAIAAAATDAGTGSAPESVPAITETGDQAPPVDDGSLAVPDLPPDQPTDQPPPDGTTPDLPEPPPSGPGEPPEPDLPPAGGDIGQAGGDAPDVPDVPPPPPVGSVPVGGPEGGPAIKPPPAPHGRPVKAPKPPRLPRKPKVHRLPHKPRKPPPPPKPHKPPHTPGGVHVGGHADAGRPGAHHINPFHYVRGLGASRVDQGADYYGTGWVVSPGDGYMYRTGPDSGWGGDFIGIKLDHPIDGRRHIYIAELIHSKYSSPRRVSRNEVIATMYGHIEAGFANPDGSDTAEDHYKWSSARDSANYATTSGVAFNRAMHALGAPLARVEGPVV